MLKKVGKPPADLKLKVETWAIEKVFNYARNARLHSEEQVAAIAASIKEFGFINPCLVDQEGMLIAGHGRVLACKLLGLTKVPVIRLEHLDENQIKALRIADNQLPSLASWSPDLLRVELNDLALAGYEISLLGFSDVQLVSFLATPSAEDPEVTPEPPEHPVSQSGDLWQLGKHRILCGDSTKAEDVERVLDGKKPHLMVTDPPYGVDYDANWRNERIRSADGSPTDGRAIGRVRNDERSDWTEAYNLFPGDVCYVWVPAGPTQVEFWKTLGAVFVIRMQIIWSKSHYPIGRGDYHVQHEGCLYAVRKGKTGHWTGDRKQSTVWNIDKPQKSETGHSTQKPIECMRRPIQNNSKPGDYVYEPFAGSFTTGIACEMMNRYCLAIEISPNYVDVGILRWQEFSKGVAILESTGQTFDEVKSDRTKKIRSGARRGAQLASSKANSKVSRSMHSGRRDGRRSPLAPDHSNLPKP